MNQAIKNIRKYFVAHKAIGSIIVLVILFSAYQIYKHYTAPSTAPRYVLATVSKGTIITSVTGTGQVSASNQIELKAKASGDIVAINAKTGDEIKAGSTLLQIDSASAALDLESAKIAYTDLITVDPLDILKAKNAFDNANNSLTTSYNNARTAITAASSDMSNVKDGLDSLLNARTGYLRPTNYLLDDTEKTYRIKANQSFYTAQNVFNTFQKSIVGIGAETNFSTVEEKVNEAYNTANTMAQAAKDAKDAVSYLSRDAETTDTEASGANTSVNNLTSTINATVTNLLSAKNSIANDKRSLAEAEINYDEVKAGPKETAIKSSQLNLAQKQQTYDDHFVTAPFDGVLGRLDVNTNDSISSGTTIGVFLSKTEVADISLNEVDIARVKAAQKVTLTFDAIDGLTISGQVVEVDLVGTVTQGVVNYNVKVAFDTEDSRVKAGMSVNAAIITDVTQDVLAIPNGAVKTQGNTHYVEMFPTPITSSGAESAQGVTSATLPVQQVVEIGTSNDTQTEITSGLKEGDQIVVRTIVPTTTTTAQAPSIFGGNTRAVTTGGARGAGR